jgi:hypothetical protein
MKRRKSSPKVIKAVNQRNNLLIQKTVTVIPQRKIKIPLVMNISLEEISVSTEKLAFPSRGKSEVIT